MVDKSTGIVKKFRKVPKKDTNVLSINLGTLAPENFDMLEVNPLSAPPPSCSSCSAILSTSPTCFFCGTYHATLPEDQLKMRRATEEYTLVQGMEAPKVGIAPTTVSHLDDKGLVVFCVDISGSSKSKLIMIKFQNFY